MYNKQKPRRKEKKKSKTEPHPMGNLFMVRCGIYIVSCIHCNDVRIKDIPIDVYLSNIVVACKYINMSKRFSQKQVFFFVTFNWCKWMINFLHRVCHSPIDCLTLLIILMDFSLWNCCSFHLSNIINRMDGRWNWKKNKSENPLLIKSKDYKVVEIN